MKRQYGKITQLIAALMLGVLLTLGSVAQAEDNTGTGDVAGDSAALVDSNTFQLFSTATLTLVKTAFLTSTGAELTSGATLPTGTQVDFMIYVNNTSSIQITDVSIQDVLDPLFAYSSPSIRLDNSVVDCGATCDTAEVAAIYAAAAASSVLTDAIGGDAVSYAVGPPETIDAGNENVPGNSTLNIAPNTVLALVFTVTMQ